MPKINLSKIGFASAAIAAGAFLAISPVFAQTAPTTPRPGSPALITAPEAAEQLAQIEVANVDDEDVDNVDDGAVANTDDGQQPAAAAATANVQTEVDT
jgi:CHASE1-domain containing sensor protein